jgi:hypothetical protein
LDLSREPLVVREWSAGPSVTKAAEVQRPWAPAHWPGVVFCLAELEFDQVSVKVSGRNLDGIGAESGAERDFHAFGRQKIAILRKSNDSGINSSYSNAHV